MRGRALLLSATLLATACGRQVPVNLPQGVWGGEGLVMTVSARFVSFDFPCAAGAAGAPVELDGGGNFSVRGLYTPGSGVAPPVPPAALEAEYSGRTDGVDLQLTVRVQGGSGALGPFHLRLGREVELPRCAAAPAG